MSSERIHYFAYGSNLSSGRLRERVPSASPLGTALLADWALAFDKNGRDGTAKANIVPSPGASVWGVVFQFAPSDRPGLDRAEGLGFAYAETWLDVSLHPDRRPIQTLTYVAIDIRRGLAVADWYLGHIMEGATEHALPSTYIDEIRRKAGDTGRRGG